jgi:hypothetical protein
MQSDYAQAYYHFKNNAIGNPIESKGHIYVDAKGKKRAINTAQQLNKNYIP